MFVQCLLAFDDSGQAIENPWVPASCQELIVFKDTLLEADLQSVVFDDSRGEVACAD